MKTFSSLPAYAATSVLKIRRPHKKTKIHITAHVLTQRGDVPFLVHSVMSYMNPHTITNPDRKKYGQEKGDMETWLGTTLSERNP